MVSPATCFVLVLSTNAIKAGCGERTQLRMLDEESSGSADSLGWPSVFASINVLLSGKRHRGD